MLSAIFICNLFLLTADVDLAQRDHWDEVHAVCTIHCPNASLDAIVLLDLGSNMELKLSKYKADQLGLEVREETSSSLSSHGTHKTILRRCGSLAPFLNRFFPIMHRWATLDLCVLDTDYNWVTDVFVLQLSPLSAVPGMEGTYKGLRICVHLE